MNGTRHSLAIVALLCAALLAGCGSSGGSSSSNATSSSTPAQSSSTPAASSSTPTQPSSTASTPTSTGATGEAKEALSVCKRIIQSQAKLPGHARAKLEAGCALAAKGDTKAVKVAAREVCEELIGKSAVNGSAKKAALNACRK